MALDAHSAMRRNDTVRGWERRNRTPPIPPKKRRNGGAVGVGNVLAGALTADLHVVSAAAFNVLGNDGETYSVVNTYGCCGDDGDECVIFEDKTESPSVWRLLTVEHKIVELPTRTEVIATGAPTATHTHDLVEYVRDFAVMACGPEKATPRVIDEMGPCDP